MIINHPIYGRFNITEPVLIELIKSPALQRLKKIDNLGAWQFYEKCAGPFSRYRHSLGVMLLLRRSGASLEEQIAGLLHDISHTAFSHVADRVFGTFLKQNYQDLRLAKAFDLQGINKILAKYRIDPGYILDFRHFPLLEKELPDPCADRIDYTLQDPHFPKFAAVKPKVLAGHLIVADHQFVFTEKKWAKIYALAVLRLNRAIWCNPLNVALSSTLAGAIKLALKKKLITKIDLYSTDRVFLKKLKATKNKEVLAILKNLRKMKVVLVPKNKSRFCYHTKLRLVDPCYISKGKFVRLSQTDGDFRRQQAIFKKFTKNGFCLKILTPTHYTLRPTP
jgi:hypothetical protein